MSPLRALRKRRMPLGWLALLVLLAAQLAISAYACPLLEAPRSEPPPCHEVDVASPALCKAFMQADDQGLDSPRTPVDAGALLPPLLGFAAPVDAPCRHAAPRRAVAPLAAPPPLIVLLGRRRD